MRSTSALATGERRHTTLTGSVTRRAMLGTAAGLVLAPAVARAEDAAMVAAAKKEGMVVWYSGMIVNQVLRPLSEGFERKYPGIKVQSSRMPSGDAAQKIISEARAGNPQADLYDGTAVTFRLAEAGLVERYKPANAASYPAAMKDPNGDWTAINTYVMTPAVNSEMVSAADTPKTLQDLLDPRWRGRMAWTTDTTASGPAGFIGTVLDSMGQDKGMEYLRKLAQQRIVNVPASQRVVLDQVIGGQYPLALMTFNHHSVISAAQGAPVRWLPFSPAVELPNPAGLIRNAPHPNAAKLLLEYVLSDEGQAVMRKADYIPASPNVNAADPTLLPAKGGFTAMVVTPQDTAKKLEGWVAIYNELFK